MTLLRRKTAAEKEQKKKQKEAKKELRKEKRETKKDAREEKKDIRKDAREAKKEIRKSDLKGKEKRDAKKDVRKDKKDNIKEVKKETKDEVKDIKQEIKEVKRWLDIKLPVKTANVALLRTDLKDITYMENGVEKELSIDDAYEILNDSYKIAKQISGRGLRRLTNIIDEPRENWENLWANNQRLVEWFGAVDRPKHVKDVHDRLKYVDDRLNKQITIRLHPQRSASTNAQNNGTFFEPKTFKMFPNIFKHSLDDVTQEVGYAYIASVMVHELMHVWFKDQKLGGETVYGEALALQLAIDNPKKARKSAENYEHYCLSFA